MYRYMQKHIKKKRQILKKGQILPALKKGQILPALEERIQKT